MSQYVCMCLSRGQRSELTNHLEESKGRRREQVTEFVKCVGGVVCGVRVCLCLRMGRKGMRCIPLHTMPVVLSIALEEML